MKRRWWRRGQNWEGRTPAALRRRRGKMEIHPHPRAFCIIPEMEDRIRREATDFPAGNGRWMDG